MPFFTADEVIATQGCRYEKLLLVFQPPFFNSCLQQRFSVAENRMLAVAALYLRHEYERE
jgi:hypothetical protein